MAAPNEITIDNLSSTFTLNKGLSDDMAPLLQLQGINWMVRKAMSLSTPTLQIKQYTDEAGKVHIDIELTATAGIKGTESRTLDWEPVSLTHGMFGPVESRSRFYTGKVEMQSEGVENDVQFLDADTLANGDASSWSEGSDPKHVQTVMVSKEGGWVAEQTWGFEKIGGARYYTRRMVVSKSGKSERARLVYDLVH